MDYVRWNVLTEKAVMVVEDAYSSIKIHLSKQKDSLLLRQLGSSPVQLLLAWLDDFEQWRGIHVSKNECVHWC